MVLSSGTCPSLLMGYTFIELMLDFVFWRVVWAFLVLYVGVLLNILYVYDWPICKLFSVVIFFLSVTKEAD